MNRFPEFFRFDAHAHDIAMVMHLALLFENRRNTINFSALILEAKEEGVVPAEELGKAKSTLDSVSALRPKVAILRNNLVAHRSDTISYADAYVKAAITPFQFRDLTEAALSIVNTLLIARGRKEIFFVPATLAHAREMLQALTKD